MQCGRPTVKIVLVRALPRGDTANRDTAHRHLGTCAASATYPRTGIRERRERAIIANDWEHCLEGRKPDSLVRHEVRRLPIRLDSVFPRPYLYSVHPIGKFSTNACRILSQWNERDSKYAPWLPTAMRKSPGQPPPPFVRTGPALQLRLGRGQRRLNRLRARKYAA